MKTSLAGIAAAAVAFMALAPRASAVEDLSSAKGSLPGNAFMSFTGSFGRMATDTVLPSTDGMNTIAGHHLAGDLGVLRWNLGGYMRVTRFGSEIGVEGTVGLGYQQKQAVQLEGSSAGKKWFFDMEIGLNASLFRTEVMDHEAKLKIVGGVGFNLDTAYVYTGMRVALELIKDKLVGEGAYTFRWGDTFDDATSKEHRIGGTLVLAPSGISVGAELWIGDQRLYKKDMVTNVEAEAPTPSRGMKGKYTVIMGTLGVSWF